MGDAVDANEISYIFNYIIGKFQQPERCSFAVYTLEGGLYHVLRTPYDMIKALDNDSLTLNEFNNEEDFLRLGTPVHIELHIEGDVPYNYYFNKIVNHEVFWKHPVEEIPLIG